MGGGDRAGHSKLTSYQMALALFIAISGPKKAWIFRAHPFQWPSKWIFPHQNRYVRRHISLRYIPTFPNHAQLPGPSYPFPARFNSTVANNDFHDYGLNLYYIFVSPIMQPCFHLEKYWLQCAEKCSQIIVISFASFSTCYFMLSPIPTLSLHSYCLIFNFYMLYKSSKSPHNKINEAF